MASWLQRPKAANAPSWKSVDMQTLELPLAHFALVCGKGPHEAVAYKSVRQ